MQLDEYVAQVQAQLAGTAALADERTQQVADTLAAAAGPAIRLAIMAALSRAADELTAALLDAPGAPAVTARLHGDEVRVEVATARPEPAVQRPDEGDATARISLRLSEALKADVDAAAGAAGISVNTWLLRAATAALPGTPAAAPDPQTARGAHRVTGWING